MSTREDKKAPEKGQDAAEGSSPVTLSKEAAKFRRSMEDAAQTMEALRQTTATMTEFQRQVEASVETLNRAARQMVTSLEQRRETWKTVTRRVQEMAETIRPMLETRREIARSLQVPASEMAHTLAKTRTRLRPILEAALKANAAAAAVGDLGVAAEGILDEVTRPPEPTSDADGYMLIVERSNSVISEHDVSPELALALLTLVIAILAFWASAVEHGELKAGQQRTREHVIEKVSGLEERVDTLSEAIREADGGAGSD